MLRTGLHYMIRWMHVYYIACRLSLLSQSLGRTLVRGDMGKFGFVGHGGLFSTVACQHSAKHLPRSCLPCQEHMFPYTCLNLPVALMNARVCGMYFALARSVVIK